jgi:hypothetical protein
MVDKTAGALPQIKAVSTNCPEKNYIPYSSKKKILASLKNVLDKVNY